MLSHRNPKRPGDQRRHVRRRAFKTATALRASFMVSPILGGVRIMRPPASLAKCNKHSYNMFEEIPWQKIWRKFKKKQMPLAALGSGLSDELQTLKPVLTVQSAGLAQSSCPCHPALSLAEWKFGPSHLQPLYLVCRSLSLKLALQKIHHVFQKFNRATLRALPFFCKSFESSLRPLLFNP